MISVDDAIEHLNDGGKIAFVGMDVGEYIQKDSDGNILIFDNNGKKTVQLISVLPVELLFSSWYIPE